MSKPWIHAESSVRRWGGIPEDYIEIHNLMDSSKSTIADNRHRALTHNAWFVGEILERVFGVVIPISVCASCGNKKQTEWVGGYDVCYQGNYGEHIFTPKRVSTRDVGEQHVLEDFNGRFIPSAQDYLQGIPMESWMNNGRQGNPPSYVEVAKRQRTKTRRIEFQHD